MFELNEFVLGQLTAQRLTGFCYFKLLKSKKDGFTATLKIFTTSNERQNPVVQRTPWEKRLLSIHLCYCLFMPNSTYLCYV